MKTAVRSTLTATGIVFGALAVVQAAQARTDVYFSAGVPLTPAPVYVVPPEPAYVAPAQPVYVPAPQPVYVQPNYAPVQNGYYVPEWERERAWREAQWRRHEWMEHERRREWHRWHDDQ